MQNKNKNPQSFQETNYVPMKVLPSHKLQEQSYE